MTFLESMRQIGSEVILSTDLIVESVTHMALDPTLFESADSVLGALSANLRAGNKMSPKEHEEFAVLYTSLTLLADPAVRAGFNIDLNNLEGQAKFSAILRGVGDNHMTTQEVAKVATRSGKARLAKTKLELAGFADMKPLDQQLYINAINKLRLAFERAKNQLAHKDLPNPKNDSLISG